jgi:hypothetical protein
VKLSVGVAIVALFGAEALAAAQSASYIDLVGRYAAGDRAAAVAELAGLTDGQLVKELEALRQRVNAGASCPSCPPSVDPVTLRAAVMLHTDRDELERRPLQIGGERAPTCGPPTQAWLAERAASLLFGDAEGREFARRWYVAMALRSLGDLCFEEGRLWAGGGLKRFAKDKELLLARGLLADAMVAVAPLYRPSPVSTTGTAWDRLRELQAENHDLLTEASGAFEQALATDPAFEEASLRLGRVRFRLNQPGPALQVLGALIDRSRDPQRLYLAHLFAGRIHEAARRPVEAEREYKQALALDADGQAAAMALSHLRLMAGDPEASRAFVDEALGRAGSRSHDDPFWGYQLGPARGAEALFAALRGEATRP